MDARNARARFGVLAFLRRHKHAEETAAEAVGISVAWRLLAAVLASGIASAAITTVETQTTYHPTFGLSAKGAAFIARNEGLRLTPYNDAGGACTTGVGHLVHFGNCTVADYTRWRLTSAGAMTLLMHDSSVAQSYVRRFVSHPISQSQFDALVDLTFNIGGGGLERSSALRHVNTGNFAAVPAALLAWSYANGVYLSGLHTRRVAEGVLFMHSYYGPGIGYYSAPKPPRASKTPPSPIPDWAWRWVEWRLGRGPYKGHALEARVRPKSAPSPVPAWAWTFLHRFAAVEVR